MAELKVGDEIKLSKSHPRHPGKKGKVVQVFPTGFVKVRLESGEDDIELKRNIATNADKVMKEMKDKGASAVHYMRGKDGRLLFKADGTTIGNAVANADPWIGKTVKVKGVYWITMGTVRPDTKFKVVKENPKGGYDLQNLSGGANIYRVYPHMMVVANSVVDNAARVRNSKWVILYRDGGKEKIEAPSHAEAKKIAEAKSKKSGRGYTSVIVDDGVDYDRWQFFNAKACNSTNPIVRKAMNACARNKAPEGWWEGKTIFAAFGWGKSVKGKVVSHKGGIIKLEDGTSFKETDAYDLYAINSCAKNGTIGDLATVKRDIEHSLRKMADFATKFTGAKTTPSSALNDPMYSGYIELTFPTEEESANFNPYYLINKLGDDKSLLPRWAWGIYGFNYNRNGQTWRIKIGRFAT